MITGKSRLIGLVVAYLDNQFYPDALEKLSTRLQGRGYHVLVFMAQQTQGNIDDVLEEILDYQVDGIVLASVAMSSDAGRTMCDAAGIPVVLFNRAQQEDLVSTVTSDNYAGGKALAEFLIAGGHRRIAYIAGWEGASTQRDREAGFCAGLPMPASSCSRAGLVISAQRQGEAAHVPVLQTEIPDAVFVANDHMAFAVIDTLRHELGLRVPEDVSVIGYDDVLAASWPSYDLTTVRQPADQMVDQTVEILMQQINDGDMTPRRVQIDGPLVIRGSTRQPDVVKG